MCIYIYIYVYVYIYISIFVYIHTYREIMLFIGKPKGRSRMISNMYMYTYVFICFFICMYIYIYLSVYVLWIYLNSLITHVNMHTNIKTLLCVLQGFFTKNSARTVIWLRIHIFKNHSSVQKSFGVLPWFIDPRVRKIRNEASSCPGISFRTLRFGRAASGGALAPEPAARHRGRTRVSTDSYVLWF